MALSVKTKEHIRRRAAVLGPKWGALLGGAAALALAIGFTGTALRFVTVVDSHGGTTRILTASTELEDVLQKAETPALGENDEAVWTETSDGERLDILRAYTVSITADGSSEQTMTLTGSHTAAELLAAAGVTYTADDILTPGAEEIVPEGSNVTLQRVSYVEYTVNETIPSAVESLPTSLLYRKQDKALTVQEGSDGLDTVSYRETWVDGQWAYTEELNRATQIGMIPTVQKVYGEQVPVSSFVGPEIVDGAPAEGVAAVYTNQRSTGYSASATAKGGPAAAV